MVKNVLVVDSDAQFTEDFGLKLTGRGYLVKCDPSAAKGLTSLRDYQADIIFVDFGLPDLNMPKFLSRLRYSESARLRTIPTIAIGSELTDNIILEAYRRGADYVMEKPLQDKFLFAILDYLIGDLTAEEREVLETLI